MKPIELIELKQKQVARLSSARGIKGEKYLIEHSLNWFPRPKGRGQRVIQRILEENGITIKSTSFDAIIPPEGVFVNFEEYSEVKDIFSNLIFVEIKTANQDRVLPGFKGYFFALTEAEIDASEKLNNQYKEALFNRKTNELLLTSVPEILDRAKSKTWQLSVQL